MRKISVPIFTEEYFITVYLGTKEGLIKAGAKYAEETEEWMRERFHGRGLCCNLFSIPKDPLILVHTETNVYDGFATLAHEASHAMDYIQCYLGMQDASGEVHAHGIASVMRHCLKDLHKLLK